MLEVVIGDSNFRERERFKKRALAVPLVEKRKAKDKDIEKSKQPKKQKVTEKPAKGKWSIRNVSWN